MLNLLNVHYHIQRESFFSEAISEDAFTIYHSRKIDNIYWNYVVLSEVASFKKNSAEIYQRFEELNRKPCVYINAIDTDKLRDLLDEKFVVKYTESWLRFSGKEVAETQLVKEVKTKKEHKDFLDLFGEVQEIRKTCWNIHTTYLVDQMLNLKNYYHFICYDNSRAVGVVSLGCYNGFCIIYNLAVHPDYIGKGYFTSLIAACVRKCREIKGHEIYALVETGSRREKWLLQNSFVKVSTGYGLCKI